MNSWVKWSTSCRFVIQNIAQIHNGNIAQSEVSRTIKSDIYRWKSPRFRGCWSLNVCTTGSSSHGASSDSNMLWYIYWFLLRSTEQIVSNVRACLCLHQQALSAWSGFSTLKAVLVPQLTDCFYSIQTWASSILLCYFSPFDISWIS